MLEIDGAQKAIIQPQKLIWPSLIGLIRRKKIIIRIGIVWIRHYVILVRLGALIIKN